MGDMVFIARGRPNERERNQPMDKNARVLARRAQMDSPVPVAIGPISEHAARTNAPAGAIMSAPTHNSVVTDFVWPPWDGSPFSHQQSLACACTRPARRIASS